MNYAALFTIAGQESRINIRNRWTLLFATVFGLLALVISYFGMVTEGTPDSRASNGPAPVC